MFSQFFRAFARPFVAAFACAAVLFPASVRADETGSLSCPVVSDANGE